MIGEELGEFRRIPIIGSCARLADLPEAAVGGGDVAQPLPVPVFQGTHVEEDAAVNVLQRLVDLVEQQDHPLRRSSPIAAMPCEKRSGISNALAGATRPV